MRDALLAFLRASTGVEVVAVVDEPGRALEAARRCWPHTALAVIDGKLSEQILLGVVRQLSIEQPALNSVLLVDNLRQQRAFLAAGATHALLKGHLDERLRAAVLGATVARVA